LWECAESVGAVRLSIERSPMTFGEWCWVVFVLVVVVGFLAVVGKSAMWD